MLPLDRTESFPALTGLRGVLCLWVWLLHVSICVWQVAALGLDTIVGSWVATLALHGYVAVDVFFMLSGFVLSFRYREETQLLSPRFLVQFWRARFARIYPLYALVLVSMAILVFGFGLSLSLHGFPPPSDDLEVYDPLSITALFKNIFLVQAWDWFPRLTWNMAAWSISSEWALYALFPLLYLLVRQVESLRWAFGIALILQMGLIFLLQTSDIAGMYHAAAYQNIPESMSVLTDSAERSSRAAIEFGVLRALVGFIGGCLLFQIYQHPDFQRSSIRKLAMPSLLMILGILWFGPVSYVLTWFLLLILVLTDSRPLLSRFLSSLPMQLLGQASYAVYLLHLPLLGCLLQWPGLPDFIRSEHWTMLLFSLIVLTLFLIALSVLVYWYVERPMRDLIRGKRVPDAVSQ